MEGFTLTHAESFGQSDGGNNTNKPNKTMQTFKFTYQDGSVEFQHVRQTPKGWTIQTVFINGRHEADVKIEHERTQEIALAGLGGFEPCAESEFYAARERAYKLIRDNEPTAVSPDSYGRYYQITTHEVVTA